MKVALYYRVSTKLQEDRFSLSAQKAELTAYAKNQKWEILNEFVDVETGGKLDKVGLNGLLDLVESGLIDAVLCMDQDRLSRLDTVSWEYLKTVLRDNEVKIAEPNGTITDLKNEDDEFMSDLRNLIARREKRQVVKRMMYGKRQRLREGKGWGVCPFEYEYDKNKGFYYVKNGWGWTIPFIDDLYLNRNVGMFTIANELNKISKTPTGRAWNEHLVWTRLTSKCFHGYQEMTFTNGETISSPVYEPLRTEETYNRLQEVRKKRAVESNIASRKSNINISLLKHVPLTCSDCGRVLFTQQRGPSNAPTYVTQHGRKDTVSGHRCGIYVNALRYEYNLVKALRDILTSEKLSSKYINFQYDDSEKKQLEVDFKNQQKSLNELTAAKDRLLDLYLGGGIEKNAYLKKDEEMQRKINVVKSLFTKTDRKLTVIRNNEWNYETLKQYLHFSKDFGMRMTRHEQAEMFAKFFTSGKLSDTELVLTTEIFNSIPIDITVPVVPSTNTVRKWMRANKRQGNEFYRFT